MSGRGRRARRSQTDDRLPSVTHRHGAPVRSCTVWKEVGHGGDALGRRIYGHLGTVRQRSDVVKHRLEQQPADQVVAALQGRYAAVDERAGETANPDTREPMSGPSLMRYGPEWS